MRRMTHTYALLEVSASVYDEVEHLLRAAGSDEAIQDGEIDMHGLALVKAEEARPALHAIAEALREKAAREERPS